jgi:hypothetical protein
MNEPVERAELRAFKDAVTALLEDAQRRGILFEPEDEVPAGGLVLQWGLYAKIEQGDWRPAHYLESGPGPSVNAERIDIFRRAALMVEADYMATVVSRLIDRD